MKTLASFLIDELNYYNIQHVFGVPGDYTLNFIKALSDSDKIEYVGMSREDSAGYAADAYARLRGAGAVSVTYSVGAMNIMNAIGGAYAERSPVVILTGLPNKQQLLENPRRHHTIGDHTTQIEIFKKITVEAINLGNDSMFEKIYLIKKAFSKMKYYSRPIYIEIPNNQINEEITKEDLNDANYYFSLNSGFLTGDYLPDSIFDCLKQSVDPVLLLGPEIFRCNLSDKILKFIQKNNIPFCTTALGKSVLDENHPNCFGVFSEMMSSEVLINFIHDSDCVVMLGAEPTDIENLTIRPHINISMENKLYDNNGLVSNNIKFIDFVKEMCDLDVPKHSLDEWQNSITSPKLGKPSEYEQPITLEFVFNEIIRNITDNHIIISDIGESFFGMMDKPYCSEGGFLSMGYYTSMSFAIPAGIGVKFAEPDKRPIVIVGDGAFQMTGSEFCSYIRYNTNAIIIILNNEGYSTERAILDGPFNDIHKWNYSKITDLMGGGISHSILYEHDFHSKLNEALVDINNSYVFDVILDKHDMSPVMKKVTEIMCKKYLK